MVVLKKANKRYGNIHQVGLFHRHQDQPGCCQLNRVDDEDGNEHCSELGLVFYSHLVHHNRSCCRGCLPSVPQEEKGGRASHGGQVGLVDIKLD